MRGSRDPAFPPRQLGARGRDAGRHGALTPLDEYRFDVGGWFVLPGPLSAADLARVRSGAEELQGMRSGSPTLHELLCGHPTLRATLEELVSLGDYYGGPSEGVPQLLTPPAPLDDATGDGYLRQWAGGRACALICMVPGRPLGLPACARQPHGRHTEPRRRARPGRAPGPGITRPEGDAGGVLCPPLNARDVLVHAASMVWGRRGGNGSAGSASHGR